jgi:curli production assembly/transport component CsgE
MIFASKPNILIFLFFNVFSFNSPFNDSDENFTVLQHTKYVDDINIEGIILEATLSKTGKEFYDSFYQQSNQLENLPYHLIKNNKKALSQLGSQISVQSGNQVVYKQEIRPDYKEIEEIQNYALKKVYRFVKNCDKWQEQLQVEELQGIGILKI